MRPVILSRPEKLAFLLVILVAGGSVTTSSPGCRLRRRSAARPWAGAVPAAIPARRCVGDARAAAPPGCGGVDGDARLRVLAERRWYPAAAPAAATAPRPGGGAPCPGGGRFGVGNSRPRGSSGTSSSSSGACCCCCLPRGIAAGRPQRRIGENIADLRLRRRAQARSSRRPSGPQNRSGQWFETSRGFKEANWARDIVPLSAARAASG